MKESAVPLVDVPVASDLPASPSAVVFDPAEARLHIVLGGDLDDASDVDDLFDEVYEALGIDGSAAMAVTLSGRGPGAVVRNLLRFVTEDCDRAVREVSLTPDLARHLLREAVGRPYAVLRPEESAADLPRVERAPTLFAVTPTSTPTTLADVAPPATQIEEDEDATMMVAPVEAILDPSSLAPATTTAAPEKAAVEASDEASLIDPDLPTDVRVPASVAPSTPADDAPHSAPSQEAPPSSAQDDACSELSAESADALHAEQPAAETTAHLEGRVPDAPLEDDAGPMAAEDIPEAGDETVIPPLLDGEEDAILDDPFSADDETRARPWGSTPDGDRRVLALRRTLRSGAIVRFPGDVVVFGDLNAGAQVIAAGDIVVLGKLRGLAHAGSRGDRDAIVIGLDMQAGQVRIADAIAFPRPAAQSSGTSRLAAMLMRQPSPHRSITPAVARVVDGEIRIEDYRGRLHA